MQSDAVADELQRFLHGETDPAAFHHADHVRMAFAILRRHDDFLIAAQAFSAALKAIAARAGNPGAYHETITLGFLALVGERMAGDNYADFAHFAEANRDLLDKSALERWYEPEKLRSLRARRTFVLPNPR